MFFFSGGQSVFGQCTGTETFNATGGFQTFYVPAGVTSITVEVWGAGGHGTSHSSLNRRGNGGGGGGYSSSIISVTPGEALAVFVGAGSTDDNPGGNSWLSSTEDEADAIVLANGGQSASNNESGGARDIGEGGAAGIGDITFSGADGVERADGFNGAGGSSAGPSGNGNSPNTTPTADRNIGGVAPDPSPDGGNGGDAGPESGSTSNGLDGQFPGGGGGGSRRQSGVNSFGGNGANGQVRITYTCPTIPSCANVIDDGALSGTTIIEFTSDCTWDAPEGLLGFEVLAVGGGGSAGGQTDSGGGGGGGIVLAQADVEANFPDGLPSGTSYTIVIGNGGNGGGSTNPTRPSEDGGNTTFDLGGDYEIIAGGGGGGGYRSSNAANDGIASSINTLTGFSASALIGGSGGGSRRNGNEGSGATGGGDGSQGSPNSNGGAGGGGGGAGGNGVSGGANDNGRNGGSGLQIIDYSPDFFSAGGGGGGSPGGNGGSSSSGGNAGSNNGSNGNTPGSGGGGAEENGNTGGNGADGIVYVSYLNFRILPVEWAYFEGRHNRFDRSNELLWGTLKEWENDHFEIQRSINTINAWNTIGKIEGTGYSDGPQDYNFTDSILPLGGGNIFYRLKQVDFDGDSTYSDTRAIQVEPLPGVTSWRVFPNPTSGYPFSIELLDPSAYRDEQLTLRVFSPIGQSELIQVDGIQGMGAQVSNYFEGKSPGIYTLEISWGTRREYHKVILRR